MMVAKRWMAVVVSVGVAGCSTLRMNAPSEIEERSEMHEARGRSLLSGSLVDESFRLGPYAVSKVDRSGAKSKSSRTELRSSSHRVLGVNGSEIRTSFSYAFQDGEESLPGRCASNVERDALLVGKSSSLSSEKARLVCECGAEENAASFELDGGKQRPDGKISLPSGTFSISSIHDTNAALPTLEPAGFRVDGEGRSLGAVEILWPGRVWLDRELPEEDRRLLGCLFVGLMLHLEPSES